MKKKMISIMMAAAVTASMLAGCSGSKSESTADKATEAAATAVETTAEATAEATTAQETTAAASGETLKIVATNESYQTLFDKFTEDTGIATELLSMSSGEVLSKVKAEGGTPMADVWFGGGIDAFMSAKEDGLLAQVDFDAAKDLAPEFKDVDNYWFSKGLTVVGFIVNDDILAENNLEAPASWDDLTKAEYQGEILMSNPAISGTNYAVVNAVLQTKGDEEGWKYFEELNKNIDYYAKRGKDPSVKTAAGEIGIGITYVDRSIEKLEEEQNVTIIYPADGMPYVPEGVAVFKGGSGENAAKQFVEWFYSDDKNLQMLAEIDGKDSVKIIKPSMEGVTLNFDMNQLMKEDLSLFGSKREEILEKWDALAGDKAEAE